MTPRLMPLGLTLDPGLNVGSVRASNEVEMPSLKNAQPLQK